MSIMLNFKHFLWDAPSETMSFLMNRGKNHGGPSEAKEITTQEVSAFRRIDLDTLQCADTYHAGT
jgi:hypothetical protein